MALLEILLDRALALVHRHMGHKVRGIVSGGANTIDFGSSIFNKNCRLSLLMSWNIWFSSSFGVKWSRTSWLVTLYKCTRNRIFSWVRRRLVALVLTSWGCDKMLGSRIQLNWNSLVLSSKIPFWSKKRSACSISLVDGETIELYIVFLCLGSPSFRKDRRRFWPTFQFKKNKYQIKSPRSWFCCFWSTLK